jgi:adenylosuccinate lyase
MVTDSLLAELFSTAPMDRIFSSSGQLQQMLRFEWALSAALEECSLVPHGSSAPLAELLQSEFLTEERALALSNAAAAAGNLAIPFVKLLTEAVSRQSAEAARFVHMGATSQDVLDTALVLQMREALASIEQDLDTTLLSCMQAARQYRTVIMPGRTWLQQGPPVTLGLKFAGHAAALAGCRTRLKESAKRALVLQFGGAVRWEPTASKYLPHWRGASNSPSRYYPGTRTATASPRWPPSLACSPAPSERSRAISPSACRPRLASSLSPPAKAAAAPPPCRIREIP